MSSYAKGRRLEYKVRDLFRSKGYVVIRAAQSKPIDLICLKDGKIILVECKSKRSTLSKSRKSELLKLAKASGACLILAHKEKRRLALVNLETDNPFIL
jgi:Holliday junction resolvase